MIGFRGKRNLPFVVIGAGIAATGLLCLKGFLLTEREHKLASLPPSERGALLLQELGCSDCHQAGSALRAPILPGLLGKSVRLQDGTTIIADAAYLRRSITDPKGQIVQGYQATMPSYEGRLTDEQIAALVTAME